MPGILVLGDINVDILARIEAFTGPGGDNLAQELEPYCGGVGANTVLALAKWGVPVRLVGCVARLSNRLQDAGSKKAWRQAGGVPSPGTGGIDAMGGMG